VDEKRMAAAAQLRRALELLVQSAPLAEGESLEIAALYEPWAAGKAYTAGHTVKHGEGDALYSVLQDHTSQDGWPPTSAASLYKRIGFKGGHPIWTRPLGGTDTYAKGDVVSHSGALWESLIDANVWEPGVYGWKAAP
jgi:hypothetical protein